MRRVVLDEGSAPTEGGAACRHQGAWYWVLSRDLVSGLEVFSKCTRGGESLLPVFCSEEDARAYLRDARGAWRPRKTGRGELVSISMGVCTEVRWVALEPLPGMETMPAFGLPLVSRESFLEPLLGSGRSWFEDRPERHRPRALPRIRAGESS